MDKLENPPLHENDLLAIFNIISCLYRCQTSEDLNLLARNTLLPLLKADHMGVAFGGMDVGKKIHLIHDVFMGSFKVQVELMDEEYEAIEKAFPYYKSISNFFAKTFRPVAAHDVDIPRNELQKELKRFFADHPQYDREKFYYLKNIQATLAVMDPPDWHLAVGFNRFHEGAERWTPREIRIAELIRPILFQNINRIAIQNQLKSFKELIAALGESWAPFVLAQADGRLLYRNAAFQEVVPVEPGTLLPKALCESIEKQAALLNPNNSPETATPPMEFYQGIDTIYRIDATPLQPKEGQAVWLLRLQPGDDPYTALRRRLQQAGLTPREVEVVLLAGDGLNDTDMAQRLFISPNTLKSHLKNIYRKLNVHSRTQLVSVLRVPAETWEV